MKITKTFLSLTTCLVLAIVLFFSNPKADQFHQYLKETIKNEGIEKGGLSGAIEDLLSGPTASIVDLGTSLISIQILNPDSTRCIKLL
jgi:spore germination protein GerM